MISLPQISSQDPILTPPAWGHSCEQGLPGPLHCLSLEAEQPSPLQKAHGQAKGAACLSQAASSKVHGAEVTWTLHG